MEHHDAMIITVSTEFDMLASGMVKIPYCGSVGEDMSNKAAVLSALAQMNERPESTARSLRKFQRSARALSSNQPRLIDEHPDEWVAVSNSTVVAHGNSLDAVLRQVDRKGVNRSDVIVRFIERTQRTLIL